MEIANAALGLMDRPVGHPGQAVLETVVVGLSGGDHLVGAGEILHGLEILCDGSESAVEYSFLNAIRPTAVSGGHQVVTHRPGVVADIAGLMARERVVSGESL